MQTKADTHYKPKILPPFSYFLKVLGRHGFIAFLITLPVLALVILGLSRLEISYPSKTTLIYDPRDSSITSDFVLYPEFAQLGNTYLGVLKDKEFLSKVGEKLGYFDLDSPAYQKPFYQEILSSIAPSSLIPSSWSYSEEDYKKHVIQSQIESSLKGQTDTNSYALTLEATSSSQEEAQRLVTEVINTFIELQLNDSLRKVKSNLETYENYLQQEKRKMENMADIFSLYDSQKVSNQKPLNLSQSEKQQLKDRERSLISRILDRQQEVEQTSTDQIRRKLELESELQSLRTRRGPTHPDVVAKQRELAEAASSNKTETLNRSIERMTRDLLELQARMKRAGIPIDLTLQLKNLSEEGQAFINSLSQKVKEYQLEKNNLENQLKNPKSRTRFRFTKEPSLESSPANKKLIAAAVAAGVILVFLTGLSVLVFREFFNPTALDPWRVQNRFSIPLLSQLTKKDLKQTASLNLHNLKRLKSMIDEGRPSRDDSSHIRTIQSLRRIEQAMQQGKPKGVHALVIVGQNSRLNDLSNAFANICGLDQDEGAMILDFNHLYPASGGSGTLDLNQFLAGACKWKDVKIHRSDQNAFDYAQHRLTDHPETPLRHESLPKLLKALRERYAMTIMHGFPGGFFVENSKLVEYTDSWVLGIVLGSAKFEDIETVIQYLDQSKLKGMFLINS